MFIKKVFLSKLIFAGVLLLGVVFPVQAQESLTLSVTPPLFQLAAVKGQAWQSSVKVVNSNSFPITIYANPVNFAPVGEEGRGQFIPIFENDTGGQTLAEWITVTNEAIEIPAETSKDIPFIVNVPENAAPGGHFAAILIGTKPPENNGATAVRTSQVVSSLFFLSIDGDVIEKGAIREFSVNDGFVPKPEVTFLLRFQNEGNVHVRPQGEIKILNMWGKERGVIPINHGSHFGNVLPDTVRKFDFSWKGESSISDIGRHTAVVTLGYGNKARQTVSQQVSFWVIPVKLTISALLVLLTLVLLIRWAIKSYVRHMLSMAGIDPDERAAEKAGGAVVMNKRLKAISKEKTDYSRSRIFKDNWLVQFVIEYKYFFVGIPSVMLLLGLLFWFLSGALVSEKSFEATIGEGESEIKINSEELKRQEQIEPASVESSSVITEESKQEFTLRLINVSGEPGTAARVSIDLEREGFRVNTLEPGLERTQNNTVIVADERVSEVAQALSKLLDKALLSLKQADTDSDEQPEIIIYVGKDTLE